MKMNTANEHPNRTPHFHNELPSFTIPRNKDSPFLLLTLLKEKYSYSNSTMFTRTYYNVKCVP
jgi:hypothetical protein